MLTCSCHSYMYIHVFSDVKLTKNGIFNHHIATNENLYICYPALTELLSTMPSW